MRECGEKKPHRRSGQGHSLIEDVGGFGSGQCFALDQFLREGENLVGSWLPAQDPNIPARTSASQPILPISVALITVGAERPHTRVAAAIHGLCEDSEIPENRFPSNGNIDFRDPTSVSSACQFRRPTDNLTNNI
jgi:hypothetical protein